jgi:tetratricopeptide (TPR) repeat protein
MAKDAEGELIAGEQELGRLDYEKAFKHFSNAIKLNPKEPRAYFGKAESSVGMPKVKPEEVASLYKKAIELDPKNPMFLEAYANFCMEAGRFNEAEEFYNKVSELDSDNAPSYYTDFAIKYYTYAPQVMAEMLDDQGKEIIAKKSLSYLLKAMNIDKEYAKRLLD